MARPFFSGMGFGKVEITLDCEKTPYKCYKMSVKIMMKLTSISITSCSEAFSQGENFTSHQQERERSELSQILVFLYQNVDTQGPPAHKSLDLGPSQHSTGLCYFIATNGKHPVCSKYILLHSKNQP